MLLALPIAFDPVRLGFNVLLISRPRPAQNLLVYWIGCALAGVVLLLVPILALHFTPMLSSFVHDLANPATSASSTVRHVEIAAGVLVLLVGPIGRRPVGSALSGASAGADTGTGRQHIDAGGGLRCTVSDRAAPDPRER